MDKIWENKPQVKGLMSKHSKLVKYFGRGPTQPYNPKKSVFLQIGPLKYNNDKQLQPRTEAQHDLWSVKTQEWVVEVLIYCQFSNTGTHEVPQLSLPAS